MHNSKSYKPLARNRRSTYDYDIKRRVIAGMVLSGAEAKSIRSGSVSLKGAFANFASGELFINNMHISRYSHDSSELIYDPLRPRKLLLHKNELGRVMGDKQNGMHVVVMSVGLMGQYLKAELGIGLSKKQYDKRQAIRSKNQLREAQKAYIRANRN